MENDGKREPNMGSRSTLRHGVEGAASAGGLALVLQAFVDYGAIDIKQAFILLAVLTPITTTALKTWDALQVTARLRAMLDAKYPPAPLAALLLIPFLGCAVQLGTMEPKQFSTLGGGTLIACETKGILIAVGDADLCSNSARGGHVSHTFADMTLGIFRLATSAVAGFFSGIGSAGAGMQAAVAAPEVPATSLPAPTPAAPAPAVSWDSLGGSTTAELYPSNPFTPAPDPE